MTILNNYPKFAQEVTSKELNSTRSPTPIDLDLRYWSKYCFTTNRTTGIAPEGGEFQ